MDTQKPYWISLDTPATSPACHYHHIQSFKNDDTQGIFTVIVEPLSPQRHSSTYYSINQRSQQGAKLALKASLEALTTLHEQKSSFEEGFLDLFMKYWRNDISLHFIQNPLETKSTTSQEVSKHQLSNQHQNSLSNLSSLYDTSISILYITDNNLLMHQIGYSQLVVLDSHHNIQLHGASIGSLSSPPLFLAHPNLKKTYPCHHIDTKKYKLEMLILLSRGSTTHKSPLQIRDKAFQLSRIIDTQGIEYANNFLRETLKKENCIVIKRNRQWYDGLSSALDRESSHLHQKIRTQDNHLQYLESKINTLHLPDKVTPSKHHTPAKEHLNINTQQKRAPLALIMSTFALLASTLVGYYLWQNQLNSTQKRQDNIASLEQAKQQTIMRSRLNKLEQQYALTTAEIKRGRQQSKALTKSLASKEQHSDTSIIESKQLIKNTSSIAPPPSDIKPPQKPSLIATSLKTEQANRTTKNNLQAQIKLEQVQKQTIAQQIINNSITFAHNILQLKKKTTEISIMNELFANTKSPIYSKQKQLLEQRKIYINKKLKMLSQKYSKQLKRLCQYSPPYFSIQKNEASQLEKIAKNTL